MKISEIVACVIAVALIIPSFIWFFHDFHDYDEPIILSDKSIEVKIGMTESQVKSILGDNVREFDLGKVQNNYIKKIYYSDEMYNLEIMIKNGKVHSKELTRKG